MQKKKEQSVVGALLQEWVLLTTPSAAAVAHRRRQDIKTRVKAAVQFCFPAWMGKMLIPARVGRQKKVFLHEYLIHFSKVIAIPIKATSLTRTFAITDVQQTNVLPSSC